MRRHFIPTLECQESFYRQPRSTQTFLSSHVSLSFWHSFLGSTALKVACNKFNGEAPNYLTTGVAVSYIIGEPGGFCSPKVCSHTNRVCLVFTAMDLMHLRSYLSTTALAATILTAASLPAFGASDPVPAGSVFVPITPCRLVDTRVGSGKTGAFGPPALQANQARVIPVPGSNCALPKAAAYSGNFVTITAAGKGPGWLAAWPDGEVWPGTVILNAPQGGTVNNSADVAASAVGGIQVLATGDTDLVIDINGYYVVGAAGPQGPIGPVGPAGPLGPPGLQGAAGAAGVARDPRAQVAPAA